jgi:hypothetical protein
MTINYYNKGDKVTLQTSFSLNGVLTNPSSVSLLIQYPNGLEVTIPQGSLSNTTTGTYSYGLFLDNDGIWYYRFESSGTVFAAEETMFIVRPSEFV